MGLYDRGNTRIMVYVFRDLVTTDWEPTRARTVRIILLNPIHTGIKSLALTGKMVQATILMPTQSTNICVLCIYIYIYISVLNLSRLPMESHSFLKKGIPQIQVPVISYKTM